MDPIRKFEESLARAAAAGTVLPEACALATADGEGNPSVRMVLLKGVTERGFSFYTNLGSRKALELSVRPRASLCFHWTALEEQVRIEGPVAPVSDAEADAYFATRPRGSQVGAWASRQSEELGSRDELLARAAEIEARWAGRPIPRPPFWSGFVLAPERIEFWRGRPDRLHDRQLHVRREGRWETATLSP